jgi:tetratricopeptide (TPR) repeat protein
MRNGAGFRYWGLIYAMGALLLAGAGFATWRLIDIPFGRLFNTVLYLALAGLILTLAVPGVQLAAVRNKIKKLIGSVLLLLGAAVLLLILVVRFDYTLLPFVQVQRGLTPAEWRTDLDFLAGELPRRHPGFYKLVSEPEFDDRVAGLKNRIEDLDDIQIKGEFSKIVALMNDAHSYPNIFSFNLDWHMYPLDIYWFDDGIYVVNASRGYEDLIGARLLQVNDTPVQEVIEAVRPYLSAENEFGIKQRNTGTILVAEWLYASGVTATVDEAVFGLDKNGTQISVALEPVHYLPVCYWLFGRTVDNTTCPVIQNPRRNNYLFELHSDTGTLVFEFNSVNDQETGESLAEFTKRLERFVADNSFDRFVIDLRANDGGNSSLLPPLVNFIRDNDKINREGRLFVITSRVTFSAAVMFTAMLDNNTKAILVGEPTSQGVKFYGGPQVLSLPNSGMEFMVSSHLAQVGPDCDRRDRITPDIRTYYNWADYAEGRDPAMEAILRYKAEEPVPAEVDSDVLNSYAGRYLFSPYQILKIEKNGACLTANITDFIKDSYKSMQSDLYAVSRDTFLTDVSGFKIIFEQRPDIPDEGLMFHCHGTKKWIPRVPEDHVLPMELIALGQIERGTNAILADKAVYVNDVPGFETVINSAGYACLNDQDYRQAIQLFKLNTLLFPESANTFDSLGESYLKAGETEPAIKNYRKSLKLNPENANAREVLESLGQ